MAPRDELEQGNAAALWPSLVEIQRGGREAPLFCAHGLGGEIRGFLNLARHLSPKRPVYGLRSRGLDGKQEPRDRIEDMAAAYIEEMKSVQPAGPYSVIGVSFGGFVAYEIARQLSEQGQPIRLLGVMDTRKGLTPQLFLLNLLLLPFSEKMAFYRAVAGARAHGKALAHQVAARAGADSPPQSIGAVRTANSIASRQYRPKPFRGRMTYIRATGLIAPAVAKRLDYAWEPLCRGGVEALDLPCDHWSVLHEPRVQLLAERLESCLSRTSNE